MSTRFSRSLRSSQALHCSRSTTASAPCKCCAALHTARTRTLFDAMPDLCSPLTPGVQAINLSYSEDRRHVRVDLGHDWDRMFRDVPHFGEGLTMTRNSAVILARQMKYPALNFTSDRGKAASGEGGLWIGFHALPAVRAIHVRRDIGHVFGFELATDDGQTVHRFTLLPGCNLDFFFEWVRLNQACSAEPRSDHDEDAEHYWGDPDGATCRSDRGAVASLFALCRDRQIPVRITVAAHGIRQQVTFLPDAVHRDGDWWFATGQETGLHFHPGQFTKVELMRGRSSMLRCESEEHPTALLIEPADPSISPVWETLLHAVC